MGQSLAQLTQFWRFAEQTVDVRRHLSLNYEPLAPAGEQKSTGVEVRQPSQHWRPGVRRHRGIPKSVITTANASLLPRAAMNTSMLPDRRRRDGRVAVALQRVTQ